MARPVTSRTLTVGGGTYPLVLPSIRDPRLHVAAVIITIHVLGQVGLHFDVTIPQILAAILTCAIIEVALTFRQSRAFVWPASAMLTGSGVALILRVVGTPADDPWNTYAWQVFAVVAGLSLLTKYVIKYRGSHVFNPSNIGLVVAFIVLGSTRVEPLDFWWAPLNVWMLTAYTVIIIGGLLITRRLHLLALAATFWVTLNIGVGIIAGSGHCMTANWAFAPVCGFDYWRVIVFSPEVLIFLFFMITDPKTLPGGTGRAGRLRPPRGGREHAPDGDPDRRVRHQGRAARGTRRPLRGPSAPRPTASRAAIRGGRPPRGPERQARRAGRSRGWPAGSRSSSPRSSSSGSGIFTVGTPARAIAAPDVAAVLSRVPQQVDPAHVPHDLGRSGCRRFRPHPARSGRPATRADPGREPRAGRRGAPPRRTRASSPRSITAIGSWRCRIVSGRRPRPGPPRSSRTTFDDVTMSLVVPFGRQTGLSVGLDSRGTVTEETYDASGALLARTTSPFAKMFVIRRATGGRWLNVAVLPPKDGG